MNKISYRRKLQQYLPFTVLKLRKSVRHDLFSSHTRVATVPTVYGIETKKRAAQEAVKNVLQQYLPFTVLKPHE